MKQVSKDTSTAKTIAELCASTESLSTFSKLIEAAGLSETFSDAGTFTIFVPSNKAFDNIPSSTLSKLLEPENDTYVEKIKKYVLRGVLETAAPILAKDFPLGTFKIKSLAEEDITIARQTMQSDILVNYGTSLKRPGRVVTKDLIASNGVIHVIDRCIGPAP